MTSLPPDDTTMPDTDTDDTSTSPSPGSQLRAFAEEQQAKAKKLEQEVTDLRRREGFRDAGLDPSNKQHAAFIKAYDGDLSPEAIQAYVTDLALTPAAPDIPKEEVEAMGRFNQTSGTQGQSSTGVPGGPEYDAEMRAIAEQAYREHWMPQRLDQALVEISRRAGRPTSWDAR